MGSQMSEDKELTAIERELVIKKSFFCQILYKITQKDDSEEERARARIALKRFQKDEKKIRPAIERLGLLPLFSIFLKSSEPPNRKEYLQYMQNCNEELYGEYLNYDADDSFSDGPVEESIEYLISMDEVFELSRTWSKAKKAYNEHGKGAAYNVLYSESVKNSTGITEELDLASPEIMDKAVEQLAQRIKDNESGTLNIKTGMASLDHAKIYLHHGDVAGILGSNGGYKSSTLRTWTYNIASQGFKQLIFPLEMGNPYEHGLFIIQHANRQRPQTTLNRTDANHGEMKLDSSAYRDFCWAAQDLSRQSEVGEIRLPIFIDFEERATWPNIMRSIYQQADLAEQQGNKIDVVSIDYLTLISKDGAKNPREFMEDVIIDLARFARHTGIAVITPVQTNRDRIGKGSEVAKTSVWCTEDIYNYSEIEKSFSLIVSVYAGPIIVETEETNKDGERKMKFELEDQELNRLRLGTTKVRHGCKLEGYAECIVNPAGVYVMDISHIYDDDGQTGTEAL
jgi:hypothetical protein